MKSLFPTRPAALLALFLSPYRARGLHHGHRHQQNREQGRRRRPRRSHPATRGMRESTTTTTDATGHFTLDLPDQGPHLIRVDHQKAGYFRIAPPGTQSVEIDVYDVAEKVAGVSTQADVMRFETDRQGLHVLETTSLRTTRSRRERN